MTPRKWLVSGGYFIGDSLMPNEPSQKPFKRPTGVLQQTPVILKRSTITEELVNNTTSNTDKMDNK